MDREYWILLWVTVACLFVGNLYFRLRKKRKKPKYISDDTGFAYIVFFVSQNTQKLGRYDIDRVDETGGVWLFVRENNVTLFRTSWNFSESTDPTYPAFKTWSIRANAAQVQTMRMFFTDHFREMQ